MDRVLRWAGSGDSRRESHSRLERLVAANGLATVKVGVNAGVGLVEHVGLVRAGGVGGGAGARRAQAAGHAGGVVSAVSAVSASGTRQA